MSRGFNGPTPAAQMNPMVAELAMNRMFTINEH
jgi:hypothetical protein